MSSYARGCGCTVLVFTFKRTWSLMHLRDFMSFFSQNLGHTKMKCSNSSTMTSRFGLMYPRLAGSCCGRQYREKGIIRTRLLTHLLAHLWTFLVTTKSSSTVRTRQR